MKIIYTYLKVVLIMLFSLMIHINQANAQTDALTVTINGLTTPPDVTLCHGDSLFLQGHAAGGPGPIHWNNPRWTVVPAAGQVYLSSPSTDNTWFRGTTSGTYSVTYTALDGGGNPYSVTIKILVDVEQTLSISSPPGGLGTVCLGSDIILTASGAFEYYWYKDDCAGGGYEASSFASGSSVTVTPSGSTCKYKVEGFAPLGCPTTPPFQEFSITAITPPTADAGADQTVCADNSVFLNGSVGSGAAGGIWSSPTGGSFVPNANQLNATYNLTPADITNGSVTLTLTTNPPPAPPCSAGTDQITITITPLISANTIAAAQSICSGDTPAPLTGSIPTGGNGTYTYQWQSSTTGAAGPFTNIAGANGQGYTPGALITTTWYRRVVSSFTCNNSNSNVIRILVTPVIANNTISADQTICIGDTPSSLAGSLPTGGNGTYTYQWQSSTVGVGGPYTNIAGATNQNYTPGALLVTTWYRRTVTSGPCSNSISNVVQILVNPLITDNNISADQTICSGDVPSSLSGTLPTGGNGTYTYQWQSSTTGAGGPFTNIAGATSQNYAPAALVVTTWYRRTVTSLPCASSNSNVVQIIVNPEIAGNTIAADQTICTNTSPAALTGSVPTGGSGTYTYQWQISTTGAAGPFANIAGATNQGYAPGVLSSTTWYRRIVISSPCSNSISNVIQIFINPVITNNNIAAAQTICSGDVPAPLSGSVPTGGNGTYTYRWYSSTVGAGGPFVAIPGATGQNYSPGALLVTTWYRRVVISLPCGNSGSNTIRILVNPVIADNNIAADQTICNGDIPSPLIGSVPTGGNGTYTYQWQSSTTGAAGPFSNIAGATGQNYTPGALVTTTWFRRNVTSPPCSALSSNVVVVNVNPSIAGNTIAADQTICNGSPSNPLTGSLPTGGSGTYTYQWQSSTTGAAGPFTDIAGATAQNYAPGIVLVTTWFRRNVSSPPCSASPSNVLVINVNPAIAGNTITADQTICNGSTPNPLSGSLSTGGNGTYTYQWQSSTTGVAGPFSDIVGATGQNYSPGALVITTWYRRNVSSPPCLSASSNVIVIEVNPVIAGNLITADQTICSGDVPSVLNGSLPTGGNGTYTYQWQSSTIGIGGPFIDIIGATGQNYAPGALLATTWYRRNVTSPPCSSSSSNIIVINVNPALADNTIAADQTICNGTPPNPLTGSIPTGGNGTYTYQWQSSTTGAAGPFTDIAGATGQNYNPGAVVITTWFRRSVISPPCASTYSNVIVIAVNQPIGNNIIAANQGACEGYIPQLLTGTLPTGGNGTYAYQWQSGPTNAGPFTSIAGATSQDYQPGLLPVGSIYFRRVVSSPPCGDSFSNVIVIQVAPSPTAHAGDDATICHNVPLDSVVLGAFPAVTGGSPPYQFEWYTDPPSSFNSTVEHPVVFPSVTTTYVLHVFDQTPCDDWDTVVINLLPNTLNVNAGANATSCNGINGGSFVIGGSPTASGGTPPYTYQWNSVPAYTGWLPGQQTLPNSIVHPTVNTTFTVEVTDANGCSKTGRVILTLFNTLYANAGNDSIVCYGSGNTLGGSPTAWGGSPFTSDPEYLYKWSANPPYGSWGALNQNTEPNPVVFPTVCTTFYLEVTDKENCRAWDTVVFCPNPQIFVDAGPDKSICNGNNGGSTTLDATAATGGVPPFTYQWTSNPGPFTSTDLNPTVAPTITTTYTLTATDSKGCSASDNVVITVNDLITANAGNDATMCHPNNNADSIQLGASPTGSGGTAPLSYLWSSLPPGFNSTDPNPMVAPLISTTYIVIVNDASGLGCSDADTVVVNVNSEIFANAGNDTSVCYSFMPFHIYGNASGGTPGIPPSYHYTWNTVPASTWTSNDQNPLIQPSVTTTYELVVTDNALPVSCEDRDTMVVYVDTEMFVNAGNDTTICSGIDTVIITLGGNPTVSGGTPPYTYAWASDPPMTISPNNSPNPTVTITAPFPPSITFTVIVSDNISGITCLGTDSKVVTFNPFFAADAGNDTIMCGSNPITLGGNPLTIGGSGNYTYLWSSNPLDGTLTGHETEAHPTVTPTISTNYYLNVFDVITTCTALDSMMVTIDTPVAIDSISIDDTLSTCISLDGQVTVWASGGNGTYTYLWSTGQTTQTIGGLGSGLYTVTVTSENGVCPLAVGSIELLDPFSPHASLTYSPNDSICLGDSITLTANTDPTNTFEWLVGGTTVLGPGSLINTIATDTITQTTIISVIVDSLGCTTTLSQEITIDIVNIDAGKDSTFFCPPSDSLQIGSPAIAGYTYLWRALPSNAYISDTLVAMPWVRPMETTTYYLFVTSNIGCSAMDSVVLTVNPSAPILMSDTTICRSYCVQIGPSEAFPDCEFQWMNGSVVFSHEKNPIVCPRFTSTYVLQAIDTITSCLRQGQLTVNVYGTITNAGYDTTICSGSAITIGGPPQPHYSYNWTSIPGTFTSTLSNPTVNPLISTTYCLIVVDSTHIPYCTVYDTVHVIVDIPPADAGVNDSICFGNTYVLGGAPFPIPNVYNYFWTSIPEGLNINEPNPIVFPTDTLTKYILTVTSVSTGCVSVDTVDIRTTPTPWVTLSSDKQGNFIYSGQIITFTAYPSNYPYYEFYLDTITSENLAQFGASYIFKTDQITNDSTWVYCIAYNNGCPSPAYPVLVTLKSLPNAFTPNGDGINDVFLEGMDLTIVNRWGQTLYVGTNGWDGRYHGEKVSPGTYYYIVKLKDLNQISTVLKGAVTIIDIKQ